MTRGAPTYPMNIDHLWRQGRWLRALDTRYFLMEERTTEEMIDFAVRFAELLTYFDLRNVGHDGAGGKGWNAFLAGDICYLLARIAVRGAEIADAAPSSKTTAPKPSKVARDLGELADWIEAARLAVDQNPKGAIEAGFQQTLHRAITAELQGMVPPGAMQGQMRASKTLEPLVAPASPHASIGETQRIIARIIPDLGKVARSTLSHALNDKSDHRPHTGLFLTFLSLLQTTNAQLNDLTDRHLEFYYKEILKLRETPAQPDRTWLTFTVAPAQRQLELPANTAFVAPPDASGVVQQFATERTADLNRIRIGAQRTVQQIRGQDGAISEILAMTDGGVPAAGQGGGRPLFGPVPRDPRARATARALAETGVLIRSSVLALSGGLRQVTLTLHLGKTASGGFAPALTKLRQRARANSEIALTADAFQEILNQTFMIRLSTAKGTYLVPQITMDVSAAAEDVLAFSFALDPTAPAIAADPASAETLPQLWLGLNPDARLYAYSELGGLRIKSATLDVSVSGLGGLQVGPGKDKVLPTTPVLPFGATPALGDRLELSHPDLNDKRISALALSLRWSGLPVPPHDLASHYASYGVDTQNDSFRVRFAISTARGDVAMRPVGVSREQAQAGIPLFVAPDHPGLAQERHWLFDLKGLAKSNSPRLVLTFAGPPYGFGQGVYPEILSSTLLKNAQAGNTLTAWITGRKPPPVAAPLPPVQPKMGNVEISFSAQADTGRGEIGVWATGPFQTSGGTARPRLANLDFADSSARYLDLTQAAPGQTVTMLFDICDTERARRAGSLANTAHAVNWAYESAADGWQRLPQQNVLSDETDGFSRTGIVALSLPADQCLSVAGDGSAICRVALIATVGFLPLCDLIQITTQAVPVARIMTNMTADTAPTLAPGQISQPVKPIPGIVKVVQPLPSQGGVAAETQRGFRTRVSERLRNKNRAISARDHEELVLQNFPDIHEAKCIRQSGERLTIVVTPVRGADDDSARPTVALGRRREIAACLQQLSAGWNAKIDVVNPSYEPVRLSVWFSPGPGVAVDAIVHRIEAGFAEFVTPWQADPELPMNIGTGVLKQSEVLHAIQQVPGVDIVTGISLIQFFRTDPLQQVQGQHGFKDTARLSADTTSLQQRLRPATPYSVLVADTRADIRVLPSIRAIGTLAVNRDLFSASAREKALWTLDPRRIPCRAQPIGVGALRIGSDLVITNPFDARPWIKPGISPQPHDTPAPLARVLE